MQNNWKNILKEKFNHREISPSDNLWEKLENELDKQPERKNKILKMRYMIAASIVLFLGIGIFWLRKDYSSSNNNFEKEITYSNNQNTKNKPFVKPEIVQKEKEIILKDEKPLISLKESEKISHKIQEKEQKTEIVVLDTFKQENKSIVLEEKTDKNYIMAQKLLESIELDLKNGQKISENTYLDAQKLLSEVEMEVSNDKKDKIFHKIQQKLDQIQVALQEKIFR